MVWFNCASGVERAAAAGSGGEQVAVPDAIMKNKEAIDTLTKRHEFIEKKVRGRSRRLVPLRS